MGDEDNSGFAMSLIEKNDPSRLAKDSGNHQSSGLQSLQMTPTGSVAQWKTYGRLWVFLRPYATRLILVIVVSLLSTGLGLVQPYISKLLIDDALLRRDMHALAWIAGL